MKRLLYFCFFRLKRLISVAFLAFMLGISNVFLQEGRMINDSRKNLEQHEVENEDDKL
ncbi:hypothetical protein [Flagellimonas sp.]|uniref:hypothetical protein n=1 Tax=Flagellimonas sp. TaxID=2058762 RepID=UPI003BAC1FE8